MNNPAALRNWKWSTELSNTLAQDTGALVSGSPPGVTKEGKDGVAADAVEGLGEVKLQQDSLVIEAIAVLCAGLRNVQSFKNAASPDEAKARPGNRHKPVPVLCLRRASATSASVKLPSTSGRDPVVSRGSEASEMVTDRWRGNGGAVLADKGVRGALRAGPGSRRDGAAPTWRRRLDHVLCNHAFLACVLCKTPLRSTIASSYWSRLLHAPALPVLNSSGNDLAACRCLTWLPFSKRCTDTSYRALTALAACCSTRTPSLKYRDPPALRALCPQGSLCVDPLARRQPHRIS